MKNLLFWKGLTLVTMLLLTTNVRCLEKQKTFLALCKNHQTAYRIILQENAATDERFASEELSNFLFAVTGAKFRIDQLGDDSTGTPAIHLIRDPQLSAEEWSIENIGPNINIKGGYPRGILYGVYDFLERFAGCHWFAEDTEVIPQKPDISIPVPLIITGKPAFARRTIYSPSFYAKDSKGYDRQQLFLARQRRGECACYGGRFEYGSPRDNHTFYTYSQGLPDSGFSLSAEGKRIHPVGNAGPGQICFSSSVVRQHFIRKLHEYIKQDRLKAKAEHRPYPIFYDISVNDNSSTCHCVHCRELAKKYGESGLVLDFVNAIAQSVEKEYPDIFITTLAYGPAVNVPQNIRANDNVIVRLALLGQELRINETSRDTLRSLLYPTNANVLKTMKAWNAYVKHMAIWDYWNYCADIIYPYTNVSSLSPNFKEYKKLGFMNIFAQAELGNRKDFSPCSFYDLRNYVASRLMLDPNQDDRVIIREFMQTYYGAAAKPMEEYLDYLEKRMATGNIQLGLIYPTRQPWIDAEFFDHVDVLLDRAETAVKNNQLQRMHVKLERLPIDMIALRIYDRISSSVYKTKKDILVKRLMENMRYAVDRYYPEQSRTQIFASQKTKILHYVNKPSLPEKFQDKSVYDYYWTTPSGNNRDYRWIIADAQAVGGAACEVNNRSKSPTFHANDIVLGIYDRLNNKQIIRKTISKKDLPQDEKYHLYYVGRTPIKNYRLWAHWSWFFVLDLNEAANSGAPDAKYDVYMSFKVQGPSYVRGSKLPDSFRVDRVLVEFIPPNN